MHETTKHVPLAVVGGSDLAKIVEQLGGDFEALFKTYEYVFTENGLVSFHKGKPLPVEVKNGEMPHDILLLVDKLHARGGTSSGRHRLLSAVHFHNPAAGEARHFCGVPKGTR